MPTLILFHRRRASVSVADWSGVWRGPYAAGLARLPGHPRVEMSVASAAQDGATIDGVDQVAWDQPFIAREAIATEAMRYLLERLGTIEEPGWPLGALVEEHVLVTPPVRGDGVKRMAALYRRPGLESEAFARYWQDVHGPVAQALPGLTGYVQARAVAPVPGIARFDGVALLWFASREAADRAFASPAGRLAQADNARFLDVERLAATYVDALDPAPAAGATAAPDAEWRNWSGSVRCHPRRFEAPRSEAEVADLVRRAGRDGLAVRVVGTGHSFTPLCASDGVLVSLDGLTGIISVDRDAREATVWGGTTIHDLGPLLRAHGLAMETMGDIDRQTIAGAVSTGTHGTGRDFGSISTQVSGLVLVTAAGATVECSPTREPELFACARVALGALGVITRVRLRLWPAYRLHEKRWDWPVSRALTALPRMIGDNHHFEFFWNPQRDECAMKALNPTHRARGEPAPGERIDWSDRIFPSERTFPFNEMEFAVPAAAGPECFREIRALMRERHPDVAWPVEYRTLAPDDIPLSPASGRDTVTISVHQAAALPFERFFGDVEAIFRSHEGRPHWGKIHTHGAAELARLYPAWTRFTAIRSRLDPGGRFLNAHLRAILGSEDP